jgi:hypothetical protein
MSNRVWPKIRKVTKHGKEMFMADARIRGKGERRFFSTRREADGWAQQQRVKRQNEGGRAFHDGELSDFGWSVQDAVRFALDHLRRLASSVPLGQAISQFIETKQTTGRSERYCRDLRLRLGRLHRAFPNAKIARITTQELEDYLSGMKVEAETPEHSQAGSADTLEICRETGMGIRRDSDQHRNSQVNRKAAGNSDS